MGRSFSKRNDFSYIGNSISLRIPKLRKIGNNQASPRKYGSKYTHAISPIRTLLERLYSKAQLAEVDSEKMGGIA
jgi:hypothetical protein